MKGHPNSSAVKAEWGRSSIIGSQAFCPGSASLFSTSSVAICINRPMPGVGLPSLDGIQSTLSPAFIRQPALPNIGTGLW